MTSMGMMYPYLASVHFSAGGRNVGYFILAWASALLVQLLRAMPEPQDVGRATVRLPRLFCILAETIFLTIAIVRMGSNEGIIKKYNEKYRTVYN